MNNKTLILILITICAFLASCSEKGEVSDYDNWEERNDSFIDSIAKLAAQNADGNWEVLKAYTLGDSTDIYKGNNNLFVYVHKQKEGTGTYSPFFNDSVRVHYSGRLIPTELYPYGYNFDKSYSGSELNELTDVPMLNRTGAYIVGFTTALLHMKEGDRWIIYMPSYLGYKDEEQTGANIPAHSTLIFEIQLARIYRYCKNSDTSWH